MKLRNLALASILAVSLSASAQKDELKTLKKLYAIEQMSAKDISEYKAALNKAEPLVSEPADKVYYNFYKGMLPLLEIGLQENASNPQFVMNALSPERVDFLAKSLNATLDYEKTNKKVYTDDIKETVTSFRPTLLNYAVGLGSAGKNKEAAKILHSIYEMDKTDVDVLYYAASYAVNGQDYDNAVSYYKELNAAKYTGEKTVYTAKSKLNDKYESFNSKAERDQAVKLGTHVLPKEEQEPSKQSEIYSNLVRILLQQKKDEEAKKALAEGMAILPNDATLKTLQSEMVLSSANYEDYKKVANTSDPNATYNLGVLAFQEKKMAEAEKHFDETIKLDPNYTNAYVNLSAVKLAADKPLTEQMNKLGTSAADNKKYDQLKAQRIALFKSVLPYLEKAHELAPEDGNVVTNLLSVYGYLEMTDKYKALKAKQQGK
ncbi:tetratricopeptide repeat protein [Flavobacterium sp. MAH-1]|uniref:Tetratricopeptide repeat protein n=1 Tax=Flavobacterium agri TaxID=2743471 RepID=A0A7Y8Y1A2_9FLAO|nr:tetratricopeptide repeat protein [Flavobacterium agri]NUY79993.1 tetratricopeptide repeat protein [Flavobacterium agri]NYA70018.1 tetratricopeptide repeat protein [Flavobacterium agri]